ncbi:hypothetical protein Sango_1174900 [Sesamum angolense]|uniref:Retrotransposon gag protein n=1 Tax=Sesamum angolense TaxID=2727404 RepID=A0AAE1WVW9_9LAMI|nr:hypothetical protein Sango_1174900 [Sesamum angolense]
MKRPEEAERKDDPKYCKYHRLVGHPIQDCFVFKDKVMQLARQGKFSLQEDSAVTNAITIESGYIDGNTNSCNATHGDNITINEDTLLEKEDSSDADDCMSTITFTDEDLLLGSKPHNRPLFIAGYLPKKVLGDNKHFTEAESHSADAKYYIEDAKKGKEVLPLEEPKSCNNQNTRKNDSSNLEIELSKGLILPLTLINMKVLKAKAQTVIFTQVQSDDEDDKESVALSNYISNGAEEDIAQT